MHLLIVLMIDSYGRIPKNHQAQETKKAPESGEEVQIMFRQWKGLARHRSKYGDLPIL